MSLPPGESHCNITQYDTLLNNTGFIQGPEYTNLVCFGGGLLVDSSNKDTEDKENK